MRYNCVRCSGRRFCGFKRSLEWNEIMDKTRGLKREIYLSNASPFAVVKRWVVEQKPIPFRFDRLRLSATVSSRTGEAILYRPTPTDWKLWSQMWWNTGRTKWTYILTASICKWSFVISGRSHIEWNFLRVKIVFFARTNSSISARTRKSDIFGFQTLNIDILQYLFKLFLRMKSTWMFNWDSISWLLLKTI